ncbi:Cdc37 N terminal kinase binding-domain-containing protein [Schizophyllum amplum]|uniref:Hsp90 chaperone protein kinase-targeting subunit n=1 Tax=Schizophyllum amplum TaxID=97359 RepID=A0A550CG84_9AGAR|nr:Cdc37 N terminal kinase binding-domain-containing protein [Auriculariopsis ampla]
MPLNYSKWDALEISDDSDIEGHPNVDKKSLIRWKQRDIHEKREQRKAKIAYLKAQIACNNVILPRLKSLLAEYDEGAKSMPGTKHFNNTIQKMQASPSKDCPPGNDPDKIEQTYDGMILSLLQQVADAALKKIKESTAATDSDKEERAAKEIHDALELHVKQLSEEIARHEKELVEEEKEQKKHITMDDIHEGFNTKYVPPKPVEAPAPLPVTKPKKAVKKQEIEVLNAGASSSAGAGPSSSPPADESSDEEDGVPELSSTLEAFSKMPLRGYEKSFEFIQNHRDVFVPGASDALLVAGFRAQTRGEAKYAKQCVHQSLLIQYCEKLGGDGPRLFFQKMIQGDKRAETVFLDDVEKTYGHIAQRVEAAREEDDGEPKEQIQLVAENPETQISFNVPDGPPPEDLRLEGPGTEDFDIEEVRKALQMRWDVFDAFPEDLKKALGENSLEAVNMVLGEMEVPVAEQIVESLSMTGILNFAEGGIRDETGKEVDE